MKAAFQILLLPLLVCLGAAHLRASPYKGGHIETRSLGGGSVEIRLIAYSDPSATFTDACTIQLEIWNSDGSNKLGEIQNIPRVNGPLAQDPQFPSIICNSGIGMGTYMIGSFKRSEYLTTFTFPGAEHYILRFKAIGRDGGILNLTDHSNQVFTIESDFLLSPFLPNSSPVLLNHPLEMGCTGQPITLNPGAWDAEDDSLAYAWATPIGGTGYARPDTLGTNGQLTLDPHTGRIIWENSQVPGTYVISYTVKEYRDGILLSTTPVEQLIRLGACTNQPPVIEAITDTIVAANMPLQISFRVWDPDTATDSIYFQSNNAARGLNSAFRANPAASLTTNANPEVAVAFMDTLQGTINWTPPAVPGRTRPYQIDLVAHDDIGYHSQPGNERALRHHLIRIWVQNPVATDPEAANALDLTLAPNPASQHFILHGDVGKLQQISAFDLLGRAFPLSATSPGTHQYSVAGLPRGVYIIHITTSKGHLTRRLSVQ